MTAAAIRIVPAPRRLPIIWWLVAAYAFWIAAVAGVTLIRGDRSDLPMLCTMQRVTGVPCGTCGCTRAGFALLHGDPLSAFLHNPFMVTLGGVLLPLLALRVIFARKVELHLSSRGRRIGWSLLAAAFLVNWAYVIAWHKGVVPGPDLRGAPPAERTEDSGG